MSGQACGCIEQPCGCCEGVQQLTPASECNRPGLAAISYRVGTHGQFMSSMKARLSTMEVDVASADGQTNTLRPLRDLKTRDPNDFSIALLDGWATVGDVLSFYQERTANEGYLRTATERRSVLEMANLVGYTLRPGVAATAYLAYTIDDKQMTPVTIPAGARSQSIPGPGELPQSFETSEDLEARVEWNTLKPRMSNPQNIAFDNVMRIPNTFLQGTALNLKHNDRLLLVFGDRTGQRAVRVVQETKVDFENKCTEVFLENVPVAIIIAARLVHVAIAAIDEQLPSAGSVAQALETLRDTWLNPLLDNLMLGNYPNVDAEYFSNARIYFALKSVTAGQQIQSYKNANSALWTTGFAKTVIRKVITAAGQLLQDHALRHDLACLVAAIAKQAKPQNTHQAINAIEMLCDLVIPLWRREQNTFQKLIVGLENTFSILEADLIGVLLVAEVYDSLDALLSTLGKYAAENKYDSNYFEDLLADIKAAHDWLHSRQKGNSTGCEPTVKVANAATLIKSLINAQPPDFHPPNAAALHRSLATTMANAGSDTVTNMLIELTPTRKEDYYTAWANAQVNSKRSVLKSIHVFRITAVPFGYNAQQKMGLGLNTDPNTKASVPYISAPDGDWSPQSDEDPSVIYLDSGYEGIAVHSYVMLQSAQQGAQLGQVDYAKTIPRTAYTLSSKSTRLDLNFPWWTPSTEKDLQILRQTVVYARSEELVLAFRPEISDVQGDRIALDSLYGELVSGRWLIVSGERADITGTSAVFNSEMVMLSGVEQHFDRNLPGDKARTTLILATGLACRYKRGTVKIYCNVVKTTHGETRNETLGNGDGSKELQSFTLKQPPLTFVAAPTEVGADSTLKAYVNDVEWHETDSLAWLGPKDHGFATSTDNAGHTTLTFGDGDHGARLPTGQLNVTAKYRNGIGRAGNVRAEQISLLQTRPLGVKGVINPQRASGGADRESRDLARENAPLSVMPLDRLVSVPDYADFTRRFAGIAKAVAQKTSDGQRELVYLTIAGVDDVPIDTSSDLYLNLVDALELQGDSDLPLRVDMRELRMLVLSAKIKILPDFIWEKVVVDVRKKLLVDFGFEARSLGQSVLVSEVISCMQSVRGVAYVDVDAFGSVTEQTYDANSRHPSTPNDITKQVSIVSSSAPQNVIAWRGGRNPIQGNLPCPAELAIFTPAVPDTLILNQKS